jgi:hypothetical protein
MKIAICLSGQPRTWKKCFHTWDNLFKRIKWEYNAEIDIFAHLWDYNTPPHAVLMKSDQVKNENGDYLTVKGKKISEEEKNSIIEILNPKHIIFEDEEINKSKPTECREENKKYSHIYGESMIDWSAGQFYSVMKSTHLKKKYELENKFRYDICFRMRCDLFFDEREIDFFLNKNGNEFTIPKHNTIYSCHTDNMRLGDIFFFADSVTFDRITDFYKWIPIMATRTFPSKHESLGTEDALYFYSRMLKIDINPVYVNPKICREDDYLELKEKSGLKEGLGVHEII